MPNPKFTIDLSSIINKPTEGIKEPVNNIFTPSPTQANAPMSRIGVPSQYDEGFIPGIPMDNTVDQLGDYRAENQGAFDQLGRGLGRFGLTTLTKLGTGLGYVGAGIGGLVSTPLEGGSFNDYVATVADNAVSGLFSDAEQTVKNDWLPVYKTKAFQNGSIWKQMQSTAFWADDAVDGLAFAASAYGPGLALKALGLGTKIAMGLSAGERMLLGAGAESAKALEALGTAVPIGEAATALAEGVAVGAKGTYAASTRARQFIEAIGLGDKIANPIVNVGKAAPVIDHALTTILATQSEAMFEAKDNIV